MGKDKRAVRNGTGSYKDSHQATQSNQGKRQAEGKPCPNKE